MVFQSSHLKILLLEDDELLSETLVDFLESAGYQVNSATNGQEALELASKERYALYLLDIKVPIINGFDFLRSVRDDGDSTPAMFITSLNTKDALLRGFQSGCDDYIKKPFDLDELALRIRALLSRSGALSKRIAVGKGAYLSLESPLLEVGDKSFKLAPLECELLRILAFNKNRVVSKEEIYDVLWGGKENSRALRVYISKLKSILGDSTIENIRGMGYLLR